jgi:N4-gp56 family major capsid protein
MSEVTLASASEKQVWMSKYFSEYVRTSRFKPYMTDADLNKGGIILARFELQSEAGKTINIPFIARLKSNGVTGSAVLDGSEEELVNYNMPISIDWRRNAVRVPKSTSFKTEINLLNAGRDALLVWESEKLRDDIINALGAAVTDTAGATVNISASTAANRNTWSAANSDRLLFGAVKSNYSATYAAALGNVDTTADKCTSTSMSLAKRMAKAADPHIRPFRVGDGDGREYYVCFHGARTFRDLKADATIVAANTDARAREGNGMKDNPIFQDGDIAYDGLIHREVPEIDDWATATGVYDASGAASCDVRPVFVCGGGAVGIAWGQEPTPKTDYLKDYGFRPGVAIEELLGVKKVNYNGVQNGILTAHFAAAADS